MSNQPRIVTDSGHWWQETFINVKKYAMKKVLSISVKGKFKQYLKISEAHFIPAMCGDFGPLTVTIVELSKEQYKLSF